MRFDRLLQEALETWRLTASKEYDGNDVILLFVGNALGGEVGELQNKISKLFRQSYQPLANYRDPDGQDLGEEIADVLYYILILSHELKIDLDAALAAKITEDSAKEALRDAGENAYSQHDVEVLFASNQLGGSAGELQNKLAKYFKKRYSPAIEYKGLNSDGISDKLADILHDLLSLSSKLNINAETAFEKKMQINKERYRLKNA